MVAGRHQHHSGPQCVTMGRGLDRQADVLAEPFDEARHERRRLVLHEQGAERKRRRQRAQHCDERHRSSGRRGDGEHARYRTGGPHRRSGHRPGASRGAADHFDGRQQREELAKLVGIARGRRDGVARQKARLMKDVEGACRQGLERHLALARERGGGEDQDRRRRPAHHLPGRFEPVHLRHVDVHHDNGRAQAGHQLHALAAVASLTDDGEPEFRRQPAPQELPHRVGIVGDDDANRRLRHGIPPVPRPGPAVLPDRTHPSRCRRRRRPACPSVFHPAGPAT